MKRSPHLLRTALAAIGGLFLAGVLAAPAAAEHPTYAPSPFEVTDTGEDLCTEFYSEGRAFWPASHDPEAPSVQVEGTGTLLYPPPDTICLSVVPSPRQIEFTGYVAGEAVAEHAEPFDRPDTGPDTGPAFDYSFSMASPDGSEIERLTVAVCTVPGEYESDWDGRCGDGVTVRPGSGGEPPIEPYCTFDFAVVNDWGSGYQGSVTITAEEPIETWRLLLQLYETQQITSVWNANVSQSGSTVEITPTEWGETGAYSITVGFLVSGSSEPPPLIEAWANGRECSAV
ncbi:cellulose binding domain-containing protein [Glycomyces xiaoerkulensis]|uniref:cellulose binding domain-containing protein n=1 Tax=Glycomyces xiaoerkulensis TaxID=2038139 RepID=UPI0012FFF912|nr:cellulose binding domain-containing protein [Glycomyces xiaoerkulensis]